MSKAAWDDPPQFVAHSFEKILAISDKEALERAAVAQYDAGTGWGELTLYGPSGYLTGAYGSPSIPR